jgi:WD40 repeat protein/serine/threonine protein kinase
MDNRPQYVSMTIAPSADGKEPSDKMIEALSRLLKRSSSAIRDTLGTRKIKIAKVQLTSDLEKIVAALKKNGLDVVVAAYEDTTTTRTHVETSMGATGRLFATNSGGHSQADWKKGEVIEGLYEVLGSAAGGMGRVYFVFHRLWKMMLAIKTPLAVYVTNDTRLRRFLREAELWVNLGLHPNIATCYYARVIEGLPRLFIEYVDGGTLEEWYEKKRLTDLRTIADLMLQFSHGMMYAESRGIIHRDVKPANCLIGRNRVLKVTDFGLVKRVVDPHIGSAADDTLTDRTSASTPDDGLTMFEGGVVGSPWYMAPERFKEHAVEDIRSDVYSFGVMLYEIVLGEMPFRFPKGFSLPSLVKSHLRGKPIDPLSINRDLPRALVHIIMTCLEKKPEDRFQSFADVCGALEALCSEIHPGRAPRGRPNLVGLKADSLNNQAVSLLDLGRESEAMVLLEEAYSANPDHLEAVYNLYTRRWQSGEISDRQVLNRMESLKIEVRETADFAHLMGLVALQRGDPARAVPLLEQASKESPYYRDRWSAHGSDPRTFVKALGFSPIGELASFAGHIKQVRAVAFAPDARRAFSVGEDRSIRIWDVQSGRCLKNLRTFNFVPVAGALSPDGSLAATAYGEVFKTLDFWDLDRGTLRFKSQGMAVLGVCFSQESTYAAAFGTKGRIRILETASGNIVGELVDAGAPISAMAFLGGGTSLAIGREDGSLSMCAWATGEEVMRISAQRGMICHIHVDASNGRMMTGSADETVRLWNARTGEEIRRFWGHHGAVSHVRCTPDGSHLITASADRTMKAWNASTGRCHRTFAIAHEELICCAISSDGRHMLTGGSKGSVRLWSLDTRWFSADFLEPAVCRPKTFEELTSLHDSFIQTVRDFKTAWEEPNKSEALEIFDRLRAMPGFCWSSEAIGLRNSLAAETRRGRLISSSFVRSFQGHRDAVTCVDPGPDSLKLLTGSLDGTAILWDVGSGRPVKHVQAGSPIKDARFIPGSQRIVTLTEDATLRIWDETGELMAAIRDVMPPVRVAERGSQAVALSLDNTPIVIDLISAERSVRGVSIPGCEFICFSSNREALWSLKDGKRILRWSAVTGRNEGALRELGLTIASVLPAPRGDMVAAGAETGEVVFYTGESGVNVTVLRGHEAPVRVLASSELGDLWVSGSDDGSLRVWSAGQDECLAVLEGHTSPVRSACMFPNGSLIASGSNDGTVRLWGLEWEMFATYGERH